MPARNVPFLQERWTLEVTFDLIEDQDQSGWSPELQGVDEAFRFARFACVQSGGLWEEFREMVKWEKGSRTVIVTADVLDYLARLMEWATMNTVPRQVKLVRNHRERGAG